MIEFITPKMYGLDDTLTKPGFGADAKAVGDALAAIEVGEGGGISEVATPNIWELESDIYHFTNNFFYTAEDLVFCQEGYIVIVVDKLHNSRRNFRVFASDGTVYYGYSEPHNINTGNGIETIVNGKIDTLDLSEYAKKSDIPDTSGFITEIPGEYITETELKDKGYLTEHQDLSDYALKTDIPDTTGFITSDDVESYGYATEDFVIEYVDNNAGGGSGGSDCGIYLWPGSELHISELGTGVYTLQYAEVYYQDDTTDIGGEEPAKSITINGGVLTIKELDMGEDGMLLQFTIVSGEEIYKGYTTVALMEDGSRIGASGEISTVSVNIVQSLDEVEGDDEMTAVPSVQLIKGAGYITSNQLNQRGYQTEAQVIALIEANMPASAEEVEY